jgi:hypothetical protein
MMQRKHWWVGMPWLETVGQLCGAASDTASRGARMAAVSASCVQQCG